MIYRQRHKRRIQESCWRGCPVKVHKTFTGHPLFVEKCCTVACDMEKFHLDYSHGPSVFYIKPSKLLLDFVQYAELRKSRKKPFLIGKVFSYLTVILPDMESTAGGERG